MQQEAIETSTRSQAMNDPTPASPGAEAPGQTRQPNGGKLFVLGTLNAEQLQECVTDWIEAALGYGCDAADALKYHVGALDEKGPDDWCGLSRLMSVQTCLMDTTLACHSTDKLFGTFAVQFIFPNVDWQRACKDALQREWDQHERDKVGFVPELEPLPSAETLNASGPITRAVEDELAWLDRDDVIQADEKGKVAGPLRDFLELLHRFDGGFRIRKTRPDDKAHDRRLIIENTSGYNVLTAKASDEVIATMVDRKFCEFDAAGVLHITGKGRELIGAK